MRGEGLVGQAHLVKICLVGDGHPRAPVVVVGQARIAHVLPGDVHHGQVRATVVGVLREDLLVGLERLLRLSGHPLALGRTVDCRRTFVRVLRVEQPGDPAEHPAHAPGGKDRRHEHRRRDQAGRRDEEHTDRPEPPGAQPPQKEAIGKVKKEGAGGKSPPDAVPLLRPDFAHGRRSSRSDPGGVARPGSLRRAHGRTAEQSQ